MRIFNFVPGTLSFDTNGLDIIEPCVVESRYYERMLYVSYYEHVLNMATIIVVMKRLVK